MQFVVMAEWDLERHGVPVETLRAWARGPGAMAYEGLPGMALKSWYSDPHANVWGAVYLLTDPHALDDDRLPRTVGDRTGPIGVRPDRVRWHVLERTVRGDADLDDLLAAASDPADQRERTPEDA
ncbi:hypothetical protein [Cellulomonas oligotrophica]|uniref:Uncharacterized protein n=1 Tax=Cellulomonas oligotrophica TaxID=931536 RepID=A0A7Y9FGR8_9CELL|nr:hypothetical protein [Cellulomonas oligotrophica]NYD86602.1 hypothetical protein [Cellulomonas oligotrophica]GIG32508.1 hypothetical protein Col01nite_16670 [Cellulomonas oligotrophica]